MSGFRLQDPWWLLAALPILALVWFSLRRAGRFAVLYSSTSLLNPQRRTLAQRFKPLLPWLGALGMLLLVVALARPQRGREEYRVRTEGIAIEMVLDRSGSMQALDFQLDGHRVDRLDAVKHVFRQFVEGQDDGDGSEQLAGRPDDLIGLIAFGGYPDAKCPLTLDHRALLEVLKAVKVPQPIFNSQGQVLNRRMLEEEMSTAIGDSLALAVDRLKDAKAKSKVTILLSDGENNAGEVTPEQAAEAARTYGIKVYTIGVGTTGRVPMPAYDAMGRRVLIDQVVRLDEATLKKIAATTGGKYFHARNTDALRQVYTDIDQMEKTRTEGRVYTRYREFYGYALYPGLALLLLQTVLVSTRFRSLP